MAPLFRRVDCAVCGVLQTSAASLCIHVVGRRHREKVNEVEERLQYFCAALREEIPVLGLQYIVEERVSSRYWYTCQLCQEEGHWKAMAGHIMSREHIARYIDQHDKGFASDQPVTEEFLKELRERALKLFNKEGKKEITVKKREGDDPPIDDDDLEEDQDDSLRTIMVNQCVCYLCGVSTSSVTQLCRHIVGWDHVKSLLGAASEKAKEKDRLQYILDTYVKESGVVGLEYLMEQKYSTSYNYFCLLCKAEGSLIESFQHILGKKHVFKYTNKHHRGLLPKTCTVKSAKETALTIQTRYGRKAIRFDKNCETGKRALAFKVKALEKERDAQFICKDQHINKSFCSFCQVTFSVREFDRHLMATEHKTNLEHTVPQQVEKLGSLKYLLDMYIKEYPLLGLEYILEVQTDSGYWHTCMLCNVEGDWCDIFIHIANDEHIERYINRHHRELSIRPEDYRSQSVYKRNLRAISYNIGRVYGRKEIRVAVADVISPAPVELMRKPHEDIGEGSLLPKHNVVDKKPSDSRETPFKNTLEHGMSSEDTSPIQELEFRRKDGFLEYLRQFKIEDKEDALFMQRIIQNFTSALFRFQEERLKVGGHVLG